MSLLNEINKTKKLLQEDMSYETIFGKKVSHNEALEKRLIDELVGIVTEEEQISEKAFSAYNEAIDRVKKFVNSNLNALNEAQSYYESGRRIKLLAEILYEKFKLNSH